MLSQPLIFVLKRMLVLQDKHVPKNLKPLSTQCSLHHLAKLGLGTSPGYFYL